MKVRSVLLALALILATAVVSWQESPRAFACSCAISTTEELAGRAELVAEGVVVGVDRPASPANGTDDVTYTVELARVWKGPDAAHVTMLSAVDGASCGLENIAEGQTIALFAQRDGNAWRSNLCDGTAPMTTVLASELTTALGEPMQVSPTTTQPPAEPPKPREDRRGLWLGAALAALAGLAVVAWARRRSETVDS